MLRIQISFFVIFLISVTAACSQRTYKNIPQSLIPLKNESNVKSAIALNESSFDLTAFLPRNYVKDASIDYTSYLQKGIDANKNVLFPNFPVRINDKGLTLKSNSIVSFQKNSKIILSSSNKETYEILRLHNIKNVVIIDPVITGERKTHKGTSGQWGMGIAVRSSSNITIVNPIISQCWGDGIYIGPLVEKVNGKGKSLGPCDGVKVLGGIIDDNRRNGISIVSGRNININNTLIANTMGTSPKAGIDVEPSSSIASAQNIKIENITTYNNAGGGIILSLKALAQKKKNPNADTVSITVNNQKDYFSFSGLRVAGYGSNNSGNKYSNLIQLRGDITISNSQWKDNVVPMVIDERQHLAPFITFKNNTYSKDGKKLSLQSYKQPSKNKAGLISAKNKIKIH